LEAGVRGNIAFMMIFANKAAAYVTNMLNRKFANGNINFTYRILPVSYHNYDKFADNAFKFVGSGYSFLMPAVAFGLSQRDLGNIKDLENNVLKLGEKLIPPSTSYTQSASGKDGGKTSEDDEPDEEGNAGTPAKTDVDAGGRPTKEEGEKADTTVTTQESREK
jgi:hypothetical protein